MSYEQMKDKLTGSTSFEYDETYFNSTGANVTLALLGDSDPHWEPLPWGLQWFFRVIFAITVSSAILLNFMVIGIVLCFEELRSNPKNYPILSLAWADLLMSLFNTPWNISYMLSNDWSWTYNRQQDGNFCKIDQFLSIVFVAASVFTLLVTSIDRYRGLCSTKYTKKRKGKTAMIIAGVWVVSIAIGIPNLYYYSSIRAHGSNRYVCIWDEDHLTVYLVYNILFLVFTYILPIFSMAYCYYHICNLLWNTRKFGVCGDEQVKTRRNKRMIKMLIWVVSIFAVGWLPYHVYFLVEGLWPDLKDYKHSQTVYISFYWLAMFNSTVNPVIYYKFIPPFKERFKQIFRCLLCLKKTVRRDGGSNQDRFNSRTLAASRKNLSNGTTVDTIVSLSQKQSLEALAETGDDVQEICETGA